MRSLWAKIREKTRLLWLLITLESDSWPKLRKCDVLLISADVDKGDTVGGRAYSRLMDSVQEYLAARGFNCQQIALPVARLHGDKSWSGACSFNKRWILGEILGRRLIEKLAGVKWPGFIGAIGKWLSREQAFLDFFAICRPRKAVVIGSTGDLCVAGKTAGVEVCELLHGIGYPPPVPWGWGAKIQAELPDKILCLDAVSAQTFGELRCKGVKIIEIEHPYYRRFMDPDEIPKLPTEWVQELDWIPKSGKVVLVGLTWGYSGENGKDSEFNGILDNGILPEGLIQAIRETRGSVFWLLRLHPVQLRQPLKYSRQLEVLSELVKECDNCEFEKASITPLHLLLNRSHGHITMISMTSYDAAFRGLKTLLLCPTLADGRKNSAYFRDLIGSGFAQLGEMNANKIVGWTRDLKREKTAFSFDSGRKNDLLEALGPLPLSSGIEEPVWSSFHK